MLRANRSDSGARIRSYRKARRLTLKLLAADVGVTESFLSQIERGKCGASIGTLTQLANALRITMSDLFDETSIANSQLLRNTPSARNCMPKVSPSTSSPEDRYRISKCSKVSSRSVLLRADLNTFTEIRRSSSISWPALSGSIWQTGATSSDGATRSTFAARLHMARQCRKGQGSYVVDDQPSDE